MTTIITAVILAYLLGSIPTSYIAGRLVRGIDIRKHGSGNVGATNILRVLGKKMGAIVLVLDMAKGAVCVTMLPLAFYNTGLPITLNTFKALMGIIAVSGHIWTVFLKFKGGKGVATTLGVFLLLAPIPTFAGILIWVVIFNITRYVSAASLTMMLSLPLFLLLNKQPKDYLLMSAIICVIIYYTHRDNIKRLISKKENRFLKK